MENSVKFEDEELTTIRDNEETNDVPVKKKKKKKKKKVEDEEYQPADNLDYRTNVPPPADYSLSGDHRYAPRKLEPIAGKSKPLPPVHQETAARPLPPVPKKSANGQPEYPPSSPPPGYTEQKDIEAVTYPATASAPIPPAADRTESSEPKKQDKTLMIVIIIILIILLVAIAIIIPVVLLADDGETEERETLILSFDSQMTLDNETYTAAHNNPASMAYQDLTTDFCKDIHEAFATSNISDKYKDCRVTQLSPGSIIVDFEIDFTISVEKTDNNTEANVILRSEVLIAYVTDIVQLVVVKLANDTPGYSNPYVTDDPSIHLVVPDDTTNTTTEAPTTAPILEACGGDLTATSSPQVFASPGFSSGKYSNNEECTWTITSPEGTPVFLSFNIFELEGLYNGQCVDFVEVEEGNGDNEILGFFCGTTSSPGEDDIKAVLSNSSSITVTFITDIGITDLGFLATYKIGVDGDECSSNPCQNGGTCTDEVLSYSCECRTHYTGDNCEVEDTCELNGLCNGDNMRCVFVGFESQCVCEDGWGSDLCNVYTECNVSGIALEPSEDWKYLGSPGYPDVYPDDSACTWVITAPTINDRIVIQFLEIELESYFGGCFDSVIISDGVSTENLCGSELPDIFTSESNEVTLFFSSDISEAFSGFRLGYKLVTDYCAVNTAQCEDYEECVNGLEEAICQCPDGYSGDQCSIFSNCGGNLNVDSTIRNLASPNYPDNYVNFSDCTWTLSADSGKAVMVTIESLELESDCYDTLTLIDSDSTSGDVIDTLCGTSSSGPYISTTNHLTITFQSDSSITAQGFLATYTEVIDGTECASDPCQNGGTCNEGSFMYTCTCDGNYAGPNCEFLDDDSCASNPCVNGATCYDGELMYTCECPDGFIGTNCEEIDPCLDIECQNGGACKPTDIGAICKCTEDYAGDLCQVYVRCGGDLEVREDTILKIGTPGWAENIQNENLICTWKITSMDNTFLSVNFEDFELVEGCHDLLNITDDVNEDYIILCKSEDSDDLPEDIVTNNIMTVSYYATSLSDLTGALIRIQLDEDCECQNGTCIRSTSLTGSYTCSCDDGFTGDLCDEIDDCFADPCVNGACEDETNDYTCHCDSGYKGRQCNEVNTNCTSNLCVNGACIEDSAGVEDYLCRCDGGWIGQFCNVSGCGTRGSGVANKIVSGTESNENDWPWQVVLLKENPSQWNIYTMYDFHFCGGTLISDRHVITAAHCDVQVGQFVALGAHDLTDDCTDSCVLKQVVRVVNHENYGETTSDNDIALLELDSPISYTDEINRICLPESGQSFDAGTELTITGWGDTSRKLIFDFDPDPPEFPETLQEAEVFVVTDAICRRLLEIDSDIVFTSNMICAGDLADNTPPDTCQGDSGGPAQTQVNGFWTLVGVTSFGRGCGDTDSPGVYSKVANYISWIEDNK